MDRKRIQQQFERKLATKKHNIMERNKKKKNERLLEQKSVQRTPPFVFYFPKVLCTCKSATPSARQPVEFSGYWLLFLPQLFTYENK